MGKGETKLRHFRFALLLALIISVAPLAAAARKGADHQKTQKKPEQTRSLPDLRSAGPVWKKSTAPRPTKQFHGMFQQALAPAENVLAVAAERSLLVRDVQVAENGTLFFISGELGRAAQLESVPLSTLMVESVSENGPIQRDLQLAQSWLSTFSAAMKIDQPAAEFALIRHETDDLGMRHLRLQQSYQGVPVWANELYVHIDPTDQVYTVNGRYAPTPAGIDPGKEGIDSDQAVQVCRAYLAELDLLHDIPANMTKLLRFSEPISKKTIWIDEQDRPHLVWQVELYANVRDWFTLMVDIETGQVLKKYSNTMSEGSVNASGIDLSGSSRSFRAYEEDGTHYMLSDLNELSGGAANLPDDPTGGLFVIDLQNNDPTEMAQYYFVTSTSPSSWGDRAAVSAMHNLSTVYNYYKNTHNRRAIDGRASTIMTVINVTEGGLAMDNAYWNGSAIFWGNGSDYFSSLAEALDICAHELTHGITEYTANLIYQDQPGALNESFSDFFGAMVDRDDWIMGEDIMLPGMGSGLRDLSNPHNRNMLDQLPMTMDEYVYTSSDYGGVHTNCGIPCYAAYLIADRIGKDKTEKIYYRALSSYLTRQSQFIDARKAIEQCAIDLYGSGSELEAVKSAFDAVKITSGGGGGGGTTPSGAGDNEVLPTTGGTQWIAFVRDDLRVGLYDLNSQKEYVLNVRVKSKDYNWTQFSTTADGNYLYFIDENGVFTRANMQTGTTETFDDIYVNSPGDLWNAAISRDGLFVAFTSSYENDNNIYLLISGQLYYLTLDLPSTQEGISSSTIQYPDVLNWSPNAKYPKLAFDAYNQVTLPSGAVRDWWSMGEIDFTGDELQIYSLLPAQPVGISVGNVQYSSIDPDRIAYSMIDDESEYWDVHIVNFAEVDQDLFLQFPGRDVERPSFSPDDQLIVVDRFSDKKLLILDLASLNFSLLNLTTGARYPEWFVTGGNYDLAVEPEAASQPAEFALHANYPNPFNAGTIITYSLPEQSRIKVAVYDLQGRLVQVLVDGVESAGSHQVNWNASGTDGRPLSSGVYFCRLETENGFRAGQKMILVK